MKRKTIEKRRKKAKERLANNGMSKYEAKQLKRVKDNRNENSKNE